MDILQDVLVILALSAANHPALTTFKTAILGFVIPLSALGVAFSVAVWVRQRRATTS